MTGTLIKKEGAWFVRDEPRDKDYPVTMGVHCLAATRTKDFEEGKTVCYEIVKVYVEPDDSIHCNRGWEVDMADIVESEHEKWVEIYYEYDKYRSEKFLSYDEETMSVEEWLMTYYNAPKIKK